VYKEPYKNHMIFEGINLYHSKLEAQEKTKITDGGVKTLRISKDSSESQFDHRIIETYCEEIESFITSNDFGAVKADTEKLAQHYLKKKNEQCKDYSGDFNVEETFMYHYGAAVAEAATTKTRNHIGRPDTEKILNEILENEDNWYFEDSKNLKLLEGAYDWRQSSGELDQYQSF